VKGVLQLVVEIDYAKMIEEKNLEALYTFTGKKEVNEIIQFHMNNLGEQLTKVVKDLPLVQYDLTGQIVQTEEPRYEVEEVPQEATPIEDAIDEEVIAEHPSELDLTRVLDEILEDVSVNKGLPVSIMVSGRVMEAIIDRVGKSLNKEDEARVVESYNGFPIEVEGMEEDFIISFKEYGSNEIKTHSFTGGN
jgi:hypothetical protein